MACPPPSPPRHHERYEDHAQERQKRKVPEFERHCADNVPEFQKHSVLECERYWVDTAPEFQKYCVPEQERHCADNVPEFQKHSVLERQRYWADTVSEHQKYCVPEHERYWADTVSEHQKYCVPEHERYWADTVPEHQKYKTLDQRHCEDNVPKRRTRSTPLLEFQHRNIQDNAQILQTRQSSAESHTNVDSLASCHNQFVDTFTPEQSTFKSIGGCSKIEGDSEFEKRDGSRGRNVRRLFQDRALQIRSLSEEIMPKRRVDEFEFDDLATKRKFSEDLHSFRRKFRLEEPGKRYQQCPTSLENKHPKARRLVSEERVAQSWKLEPLENYLFNRKDPEHILQDETDFETQTLLENRDLQWKEDNYKHDEFDCIKKAKEIGRKLLPAKTCSFGFELPLKSIVGLFPCLDSRHARDDSSLFTASFRDENAQADLDSSICFKGKEAEDFQRSSSSHTPEKTVKEEEFLIFDRYNRQACRTNSSVKPDARFALLRHDNEDHIDGSARFHQTTETSKGARCMEMSTQTTTPSKLLRRDIQRGNREWANADENTCAWQKSQKYNVMGQTSSISKGTCVVCEDTIGSLRWNQSSTQPKQMSSTFRTQGAFSRSLCNSNGSRSNDNLGNKRSVFQAQFSKDEDTSFQKKTHVRPELHVENKATGQAEKMPESMSEKQIYLTDDFKRKDGQPVNMADFIAGMLFQESIHSAGLKESDAKDGEECAQKQKHLNAAPHHSFASDFDPSLIGDPRSLGLFHASADESAEAFQEDPTTADSETITRKVNTDYKGKLRRLSTEAKDHVVLPTETDAKKRLPRKSTRDIACTTTSANLSQASGQDGDNQRRVRLASDGRDWQRQCRHNMVPVKDFWERRGIHRPGRRSWIQRYLSSHGADDHLWFSPHLCVCRQCLVLDFPPFRWIYEWLKLCILLLQCVVMDAVTVSWHIVVVALCWGLSFAITLKTVWVSLIRGFLRIPTNLGLRIVSFFVFWVLYCLENVRPLSKMFRVFEILVLTPVLWVGARFVKVVEKWMKINTCKGEKKLKFTRTYRYFIEDLSTGDASPVLRVVVFWFRSLACLCIFPGRVSVAVCKASVRWGLWFVGLFCDCLRLSLDA